MDMRIPPLRIEILLESNPLKSKMLVGGESGQGQDRVRTGSGQGQERSGKVRTGSGQGQDRVRIERISWAARGRRRGLAGHGDDLAELLQGVACYSIV